MYEEKYYDLLLALRGLTSYLSSLKYSIKGKLFQLYFKNYDLCFILKLGKNFTNCKTRCSHTAPDEMIK